MTIDESKKISKNQLLVVLIHSQIGVGIITLPSEVFEKAKSDSWLAIIFAGIVVQVIIFIFGFLIKRFPENNLFEIFRETFGLPLGRILILFTSLYFIVQAGAITANFSLILKSWMMPNTPKSIIVLLALGLAVYGASGNLIQISRMFTLTIGLMFVFIGFAIYSLKSAKLTYLLPIGIYGLGPISGGALVALHSFLGFEFIIMLYPCVNANRGELIKITSLANLIVTLFYTFAVICSIMFFSPKEMTMLPEPILYLVKSFTFKIIERPDLIFISLWIVFVMTTLIMMLYVVTIGLTTLTTSIKKQWLIVFATILIYLVGISTYGEYKIATLYKYLNPSAIVFSIFLPILTLLFSLILKRKGEA